MRVVAVNIGGTIIEFHNSGWTGTETVYVNGKLASEKHSFFGTNHFFQVMEEGSLVNYELKSRHNAYGSLVADIKRNGVYVLATGSGHRKKVV